MAFNKGSSGQSPMSFNAPGSAGQLPGGTYHAPAPGMAAPLGQPATPSAPSPAGTSAGSPSPAPFNPFQGQSMIGQDPVWNPTGNPNFSSGPAYAPNVKAHPDHGNSNGQSLWQMLQAFQSMAQPQQLRQAFQSGMAPFQFGPFHSGQG